MWVFSLTIYHHLDIRRDLEQHAALLVSSSSITIHRFLGAS